MQNPWHPRTRKLDAMNKLALIALSSAASLALVAGCSAGNDENVGDSSQDLVSATSAYTDVGKNHPLDACKLVWEKEELMGTRYDCGGQGDYSLIAESWEETGLAPSIKTPTGIYSLDLWSHGVNTYYGYHGKLAEWRGRGLAIGKVEPSALIMRVFTPGSMDAAWDFQGNNSLVVVKLAPDGACVHSVVSGATPNHNQLARDITDSAEFKAFTCPAATPEPLPSSQCGTLKANEGLMPDQALKSCSGSHSLVMQSDGNLVVYNNRTGKATWSSRTVGAEAQAAIMRPNGQLGVFETELLAKFSTPTAGNDGAFLAMQDDGNLVIYTSNGGAVWATNTQGK